jgi:hypothetical protein
MPDYDSFLKEQVGAAFIEGVFGPALLQQSLNFISDMWAFDNAVSMFLTMLPPFLMPRAYKARDRLVRSVKQWQAYAREHFHPSDIDLVDGTDLYWGSEMICNRQKKMLGVDKLDYDAIAVINFGLIGRPFSVPCMQKLSVFIPMHSSLATRCTIMFILDRGRYQRESCV